MHAALNFDCARSWAEHLELEFQVRYTNTELVKKVVALPGEAFHARQVSSTLAESKSWLAKASPK